MQREMKNKRDAKGRVFIYKWTTYPILGYFLLLADTRSAQTKTMLTIIEWLFSLNTTCKSNSSFFFFFDRE